MIQHRKTGLHQKVFKFHLTTDKETYHIKKTSPLHLQVDKIYIKDVIPNNDFRLLNFLYTKRPFPNSL